MLSPLLEDGDHLVPWVPFRHSYLIADSASQDGVCGTRTSCPGMKSPGTMPILATCGCPIQRSMETKERREARFPSRPNGLFGSLHRCRLHEGPIPPWHRRHDGFVAGAHPTWAVGGIQPVRIGPAPELEVAGGNFLGRRHPAPLPLLRLVSGQSGHSLFFESSALLGRHAPRPGCGFRTRPRNSSGSMQTQGQLGLFNIPRAFLFQRRECVHTRAYLLAKRRLALHHSTVNDLFLGDCMSSRPMQPVTGEIIQDLIGRGIGLDRL